MILMALKLLNMCKFSKWESIFVVKNVSEAIYDPKIVVGCCRVHQLWVFLWLFNKVNDPHSYEESSQSVAPLPSSTARPRPSSLGGSKERYGESSNEIARHSRA